MNKKCSECNSLYEPPYFIKNKKGKLIMDRRKFKASSICPKCVEKILLDYEQKQQQDLDYYNHGTFNKHGYNYIWTWILLPQNQLR